MARVKEEIMTRIPENGLTHRRGRRGGRYWKGRFY